LARIKMLIINKTPLDIYGKKKKTLTMETHLFMLVTIVSNSTMPFVMSRTNESTLMCQSGSLGWFTSMHGRQA
jgi:hypothetical protein